MDNHSLKEDGRPSIQWYFDDWFSEFGLRLCSLEARGLWIDMLGIMFKAEIRGTLAVNGKQVDNKALAKLVGAPEEQVDKCLMELKKNDVFSILEDDGTVYSRRMYRESGRQKEISEARSKAGKKGMASRYNKNITKSNKDKKEPNKDVTKIPEVGDNNADNKSITSLTASPPTPTSSSSSSPTPKEIKEKPLAPTQKSSSVPIVAKIGYCFESREWKKITEKDKKQWAEAYPACDIDSELKKMGAWLIANPKQKKSNYRRFIVNWLSKTQDRGGAQQTKGVERKGILDKWVESKK